MENIDVDNLLMNVDDLFLLKKQKYVPDFTKVKCTVHLLLMFVAEQTEKDKNYTFTARDIADTFGTSRNAAWNLIRRIEKFGNFKKIVESHHVIRELNGTKRKVPSKTPGVYQITYIGMRYARKLAQDAYNELLLPDRLLY